MKRRILWLPLLLAAILASCTPRERTLVLLSTNDMHARIQRFPQLAAAVAACRDTAQYVVLVDAGDRWTGNAYVDMAPTPGMPILELMNALRYDVATLGNHEFDRGQAYLGRMLDSVAFEVVCANVVSDTCTFPQMAPYTVLERGGVRIGFVGVVTNYEGPGHPAGNASSFAGLEFPDPQQMAARYGAELRGRVDVLVLVSHMGDDRDEEYLATGTPYDVVIGGHTHVVRDTLVGGVLLTQTGKNLANVGVTTIRLKGRKVVGREFRVVPLDGYDPDPACAERVAHYYADPELNRPIGEFASAADAWGVANWMADAVADEADAEIGIYHVGGVRLDSIPAGGVGTARIFDLEPFGTQIARIGMTPAQLRRLIVTKYNDTEKGVAPRGPRRDDPLRDHHRPPRQRPRRALPPPCRGAPLPCGHERLRLPKLQGVGGHRRPDHRPEGGGRAAGGARRRLARRSGQPPAAAGGPPAVKMRRDFVF